MNPLWSRTTACAPEVRFTVRKEPFGLSLSKPLQRPVEGPSIDRRAPRMAPGSH